MLCLRAERDRNVLIESGISQNRDKLRKEGGKGEIVKVKIKSASQKFHEPCK